MLRPTSDHAVRADKRRREERGVRPRVGEVHDWRVLMTQVVDPRRSIMPR
jgi:hypothetical protein